MKLKKFAEEFKEFIARGNVVDMAVAVIIGGAFGKIVTSLVNDILMPLIGRVTGGFNVSDWKYVLAPAEVAADGTVITPENALCYGSFLQSVLDFLIIALCIFLMLKVLLAVQSRFHKTQEEEVKEEENPAPTETELLTEIRDLLKAQQGETVPALPTEEP